VGRAIERAAGDRVHGSDPAQPQRCSDGPPCRCPPTPTPGRRGPYTDAEDALAHAQTLLRDNLLDAGVSLRDVQIAARHADPKTTMSLDRACKNLDRHPNDVLAAYMASGI
jgi:hypothetical protein